MGIPVFDPGDWKDPQAETEWRVPELYEWTEARIMSIQRCLVPSSRQQCMLLHVSRRVQYLFVVADFM
jgi:hypothetical protein